MFHSFNIFEIVPRLAISRSIDIGWIVCFYDGTYIYAWRDGEILYPRHDVLFNARKPATMATL